MRPSPSQIGSRKANRLSSSASSAGSVRRATGRFQRKASMVMSSACGASPAKASTLVTREFTAVWAEDAAAALAAAAMSGACTSEPTGTPSPPDASIRASVSSRRSSPYSSSAAFAASDTPSVYKSKPSLGLHAKRPSRYFTTSIAPNTKPGRHFRKLSLPFCLSTGGLWPALAKRTSPVAVSTTHANAVTNSMASLRSHS